MAIAPPPPLSGPPAPPTSLATSTSLHLRAHSLLLLKPPPFPARAPPLRAHGDHLLLLKPPPFPARAPPLRTHGDRPFLGLLAALKKPALALLLAGVQLEAARPHPTALAASGGRVGKSAFSSRSSPLFYSPSPFVYIGPTVGIEFGGSGFLVVLMGFAAFLYLAGFLSDSPGGGSMLTETQKTTVLKL